MNKHNLEIDRLRGIAILIVVYCHFARIYFPWAVSLDMQFFTSIIDLFFVISGYVISSIVIPKIDTLKTTRHKPFVFIKAFYVGRFIRIYPLAFAVFLIVLFSSLFLNTARDFATPSNTILEGIAIFAAYFNYYFLYHFESMALAPYWSLSIEIFFYLLFPWFVLASKNNNRRFYIYIVLLFSLTFIIRPLTLQHFPLQGIYFTQTRLDGVIYGSLIYLLTRNSQFNIKKYISPTKSIFKMLLVIAIFALLGWITKGGMPTNVFIPLGCILSSILVTAAVMEKNIVAFPTLIQTILDIAGARAYSIYLIHIPSMLLAKQILYQFDMMESLSSSQLFFFVILCLLLSVEVMYRLVEVPCLKLSHVWAKKIMQPKQSFYSENKIDYAKETDIS